MRSEAREVADDEACARPQAHGARQAVVAAEVERWPREAGSETELALLVPRVDSTSAPTHFAKSPVVQTFTFVMSMMPQDGHRKAPELRRK